MLPCGLSLQDHLVQIPLYFMQKLRPTWGDNATCKGLLMKDRDLIKIVICQLPDSYWIMSEMVQEKNVAYRRFKMCSVFWPKSRNHLMSWVLAQVLVKTHSWCSKGEEADWRTSKLGQKNCARKRIILTVSRRLPFPKYDEAHDISSVRLSSPCSPGRNEGSGQLSWERTKNQQEAKTVNEMLALWREATEGRHLGEWKLTLGINSDGIFLKMLACVA